MVGVEMRATEDARPGAYRTPPGGRSYWPPNMSGTTMLLGGLVLASAVGYYWLYADRKQDRAKEVNRTDGGSVEPPESRLPRK
ncbi:hypothetical protein CRG98_006905 [Punica granatum]|nr:hypothetical protein CRG98_006905 [Punica granatum]